MRHTPAAIQQFLAEQPLSGQTVANFCEDRNLEVPTFYAWKRKYAESEMPTSEGFCKIIPKQEIALRDGKTNVLRHELEQLKRLIFAARSEKLRPADLVPAEQLGLNFGELQGSNTEVEEQSSKEKITYERRKKREVGGHSLENLLFTR